MNNMDRIEINGIWYVREDQQQDELIVLDPANYHGCVVEDSEFAIEATKTLRNDGGYYDCLDIKFTDKRSKPWKEETWDHPAWMRGVLNNNPESLNELPDIGPKGIKFLQAFLKHLKDKEWL
jgi:hypothetical protein